MLYRMQRQEIIVLKEGTSNAINVHLAQHTCYIYICSMNTICKINLKVKEEKEVLRRNFTL